MRRKLLVMLMAVCMTVSLVACGNGDSGNKKESSSETVVENETSEEKETTEDSENLTAYTYCHVPVNIHKKPVVPYNLSSVP